MLLANNIGLQIEEKRILNSISLQLQAGEILGLLGRNGAGKSSLLKILAGSQKKYKGEVQLNGNPLPKWEARALAKQRAVLSQQMPMTFSMDVLEVVKMGRFPYQLEESSFETSAIAFWCLEQVGMQDFKYRNIQTLSGGERQRVHFARVLAQLYVPDVKRIDYKFLLLDEPIASLDMGQQHQLFDLLKRMAREWNYGILIILHDLNLAAQYTDRLLLLKNGACIVSGSTPDVLTLSNIQNAFDIDVNILRPQALDYPLIVMKGASFELLNNNYGKRNNGIAKSAI